MPGYLEVARTISTITTANMLPKVKKVMSMERIAAIQRSTKTESRTYTAQIVAITMMTVMSTDLDATMITITIITTITMSMPRRTTTQSL